MTTLSIYAIKDEKIGIFINPFFVPDIVTAIRSLTIALRGGDSNLKQFPADFSLWQIGTLDEVTGALTPKLEYASAISALLKDDNNNPQKNNNNIPLKIK